MKEDIKKVLLDFCESAEIEGCPEQVIRKSCIDYVSDKILTLLQSNDAGQPNGSKPNVSGSATTSSITTDKITTDTTIWKGGYVTDNFHSYYLDENMVKHYR